MLSFLKVFARGIICTILLPFIILVWVLHGVYCLVMFFVVLFKSIFLFFAGDNATGELKEDIEARKILLEKEQSQEEQAQVMSMMYQNMAAQQMYGQPMMQQPMMQQPSPQPAVMPTPEVPEENDFDPFAPTPEESNVSFGSEEINEEGGNDDGQSY